MRRQIEFSAIAIATVLTTFFLFGDIRHTANAQEVSLRPLCTLWDQQASEAITNRVQESMGEVDLCHLGDSIFRMRRARRSCDIGLIWLACQDYIAIMRGMAGISSEWEGSTRACPLAMADKVGSDQQQAIQRDAQQ